MLNIGIAANTGALEKRRIQLVNFIAIVSILVGTLSEAYTMYESGFMLISMGPYLIALLLFAGVIYANAHGHYDLGRVIIALLANASLAFHFYGIAPNLMAVQLHLVNYIIYIAIFEKFKTIIFWSVITLTIYLLGTYLQLNHQWQPVFSPPPNLVPAYRYIYIAGTSILITSITLFFKKVNDDYQEELSKTNIKLQDAIATINVQNKQLKVNVSEKEVLLQEVHHRVKNNLQVIASLIDLQLDKHLEDFSCEVLTECKNRVTAMALVHEKLYQSDALEPANLKEYVGGLIDNISESYSSVRVKVAIEVDAFALDMDRTIHLGLIINELVTNAYKHAFTKIKHPALEVKLKKKKNRVELSIKDNGAGMSTRKINLGTDDTKLGINLVHMLTRQLKGNVTFVYEPGLQVLVDFTV